MFCGQSMGSPDPLILSLPIKYLPLFSSVQFVYSFPECEILSPDSKLSPRRRQKKFHLIEFFTNPFVIIRIVYVDKYERFNVYSMSMRRLHNVHNHLVAIYYGVNKRHCRFSPHACAVKLLYIYFFSFFTRSVQACALMSSRIVCLRCIYMGGYFPGRFCISFKRTVSSNYVINLHFIECWTNT